MSKQIESVRTFFPYCKVPNCGGILLIIRINDNFSIDYKCSKNEKHNGKNIYFKTFERFYLIENKIEKCCQCNKSFIISDIEYQYKCKECETIFCTSCFIKHIHYKKDVNINELIINNQLCKIHNQKLIYYCTECKNYFCESCKENKECKTKDHIIKHSSDIIPTKNKINNLLNKLKAYDELVKSIDDWKNALMKKIEHLKEQILNEKYFSNKMVSNSNCDLIDYSNYLNFDYLYNYKNNIFNFINEIFTFDKKTEFLMKYLYDVKYCEKEENLIEERDLEMETTNKFNEKNIDEESYNEISNITFDKDLHLLKEIDNSGNFANNEELSSVVENKKMLKINNDKYKIIEKDDGKGCFLKCIHVGQNFIATINKEEFKEINENEDNGSRVKVIQYIIYIWEKKINENVFLNIKKYTFPNKIYDIMYANNQYLVSHNEDKIIFFSHIYFEIENKIFIKCKYLKECNKYLIANCSKYEHIIIGIISIENKDLIQYIEDPNIQNSNLLIVYNNMIYILYKNIGNKSFIPSGSGDRIVDFEYNCILKGYQIIDGEIKQISQYNISKFLDDELWGQWSKMYDEYEIDCFEMKYNVFKDIKMNIHKNHLLLYYNNDYIYISKETLN